MKRFLLLSATLLFIASAHSQSKVVFQDIFGIDLSDTVQINYVHGLDHLALDCNITNTDTVNSYKIWLKRIVKQTVPDAIDMLCIGLYCNEFSATDTIGMTAGGDSIYKDSKIRTTQPWELITFNPDSTDGTAIYQYFLVSETDQPGVYFNQDSVVVKYNLTGVGIFDHKNKNMATINSYPNPVSDKLNIRFQIPASKNAVLVVYNMLGQKMYSTELDNSDDIQEIASQDWKSGLYFVAIESQGLTLASKKIIKK